MISKEGLHQIRMNFKEFKNFLRTIREQVYNGNAPESYYNIIIELSKLHSDIKKKPHE